MQNRIEILANYLAQGEVNPSPIIANMFIHLRYLCERNLFTQQAAILEVTASKSGLQLEEECDAIIFLIAFIERYPYNSVFFSLRPEFKEFIDVLTGKDLMKEIGLKFRQKEYYHEMVYWGLFILRKYQVAKQAELPFAAELATQAILRIISPLIDVAPLAYNERFLTKKAESYKQYVARREAYRAKEVPVLRTQLAQAQSNKKWALACLIPGVFLFMDGFPTTWELMRAGQFGGALFCFLCSVVASVISPVGVFVYYFGWSNIETMHQDAIAKSQASHDQVVKQVYNKNEYKSLLEFRKKLKEEHKETVNAYPSKYLNKPKKCVEFCSDNPDQVVVYTDQEQARRLAKAQALRNGECKDAITFFQDLKKSKLESIKIAQLVYLDHEKQASECRL